MKRHVHAVVARIKAARNAQVAAGIARRKVEHLADRLDAGDETAAAELAELLDVAGRAIEQTPEPAPAPTRPAYQTPAQLAEERRLADQRARRQRRAEDGVTGTPKRRTARPTAGPKGASNRTTPKGTRP